MSFGQSCYYPSFRYATADSIMHRLLDPPGLQTIMTCTEQGAFHPQSVPFPFWTMRARLTTLCSPEGAAIYTDCDEGHVELTNGLRLEICDLRN